MKTTLVAALGTVAFGGVPAAGQESVRVAFPAGTTGAVIEDAVTRHELTGHERVDFLLCMAAGQTIQARLASAGSAHFNSNPSWWARMTLHLTLDWWFRTVRRSRL